MRVMCIAELPADISHNRLVTSPVKVGEVYHVLDEYEEENGRKYYLLMEFGDDSAFAIGAFFPLSDDEGDLEEEEVEEHELATA
jgi:hypothetical protein